MNTKNNRYLTTVEANTYNRVETLIEIINELISILEYTKRNPKFYMSAIVEKGLNSIKRHDEIKDLTNLLLAFEYTPRYDEIIEAISHFKALCQEMGTKIDISMPEYEMRFKGEIISCCLLLGEFANKINKRTPQPGDEIIDFSRLYTYTPLIGFDISALYKFMIDNGVINSVDLELFTKCIEHAHIAKLWESGTQYKIKWVMHHLKYHFSRPWFDAICKSVGLDKESMGKYNYPNRKRNEDKLRNILKYK